MRFANRKSQLLGTVAGNTETALPLQNVEWRLWSLFVNVTNNSGGATLYTRIELRDGAGQAVAWWEPHGIENGITAKVVYTSSPSDRAYYQTDDLMPCPIPRDLIVPVGWSVVIIMPNGMYATDVLFAYDTPEPLADS